MRSITRSTSLLLALLLAMAAYAVNDQDETVYQVATINALLQGLYDGYVPVSELLSRGDFGLGTFDHLDGEMVILDGVCYQITAESAVTQVEGTVTSPFAAVTRFSTDHTISIEKPVTIIELEAMIDAALPKKNLFYAIRVTGEFGTIKARSVPRQTAPYVKLVDVVATQPVFALQEQRGTLAGFRCPAFVGGINVPGYHFHYMSDDRKTGGHVLDALITRGSISIDATPFFQLHLPQMAAFQAADLTSDTPEELQKVEK